MHIPDGYLSPATCGVFYAAMAPVWYFASKRAEKALKLREMPIFALGAAFVFVIMMFNIPLPGGSSGHMVGGAVVAIALGPWAGIIAMSLALAIQAFLFGDGGLLTLAANCFNMAVVMSLSGYVIYRALAFGEPGSKRRFFAAAIAAYVAVNLAALAAAVELGIQPALATGPDGRPLYAPYPLSIAVPAMMLPHLVFFGPIEAIGTALVVNYVHGMERGLLHAGRKGSLKPLWIAMAVLAVLTPVGLIASGTPWGEWGKDELINLIGYVPAGMEKYGEIWKGFVPDYSLPRMSGLPEPFVYMLSALLGSALLVAAVYAWGRLWRR
ncbi:MAG: cobalt transporter CbiM [Deltaproteobacteria bacterium]|nr:cobalt transporter CbiM [Deltaproteobacteria bacterium]MBZ0219604.1 cobalt transporter CbiM [Deltaproteobacteria bacterium]